MCSNQNFGLIRWQYTYFMVDPLFLLWNYWIYYQMNYIYFCYTCTSMEIFTWSLSQWKPSIIWTIDACVYLFIWDKYIPIFRSFKEYYVWDDYLVQIISSTYSRAIISLVINHQCMVSILIVDNQDINIINKHILS